MKLRSIIDVKQRSETSRISIGFNPEPESVRQGAGFCTTRACPLMGISLAQAVTSMAIETAWRGIWETRAASCKPLVAAVSFLLSFHPMKGPMTTQSLRGIIETSLLHWRGDPRRPPEDFNPGFCLSSWRTA
jgi:hypothetical protein